MRKLALGIYSIYIGTKDNNDRNQSLTKCIVQELQKTVCQKS